MFELSEENELMRSDDSQVKLTTHRIIYESEEGRQQVMLEDFQSYSFIYDSIGAYGILFYLFLVIIIGVFISTIIQYLETARFFRNRLSLFEEFWLDDGFRFLLTLLFIFFFFYRISRRNMIRINGKYNSFEFRVNNFRNRSLQKMLRLLEEQSKIRKG